MHVPRWIRAQKNKLQDFAVHVFGDASESAYGVVLYLTSIIDNDVTVRLICSRAILAPMKRVTLPRLELLAALVASWLLRYFCEATEYISQATLWSDSAIALAWMRGEPNRCKTFVCNRVTEILEYTALSQRRHCPGSENPADILSRGLHAQDLRTSTTSWNGHAWLRGAQDN
jgi:hypothetical protein